MNEEQESISVDQSDPGLVTIDHVHLVASGVDMGGRLVIDRANVPHLIALVERCLAWESTSGHLPVVEADQLKVFSGGHDQRPIVNVINRRDPAARQGGVYAIGMTEPIAQQLVELLRV